MREIGEYKMNDWWNYYGGKELVLYSFLVIVFLVFVGWGVGELEQISCFAKTESMGFESRWSFFWWVSN